MNAPLSDSISVQSEKAHGSEFAFALALALATLG